MREIFLNVLEASFYGSVVILAVLLLRLLLKKAPKKYACMLWILVGLRLLLPIRIESAISLQPDVATFSQIQTEEEIPQAPENVTPAAPENPAAPESPAVPGNPGVPDHVVIPEGDDVQVSYQDNAVTGEHHAQIDYMAVIGGIWLAIAVGFVIFNMVSYLRLKRRVRDAVKVPGGWASDKIETAFILGYIKPQIYVPMSMNLEDRSYIMRHERAHLDKGDHWCKLAGFVVLSIHWFNPLVWVAYILLCRDIEMACDERVIRNMELKDRKRYSAALLSCSTNHAHLAACPVAFGEVSVKTRIKSVLKYRKPRFWISLVAVLAVLFVLVCFLTNPVEKEPADSDISATEEPTVAPTTEQMGKPDDSVSAEFELVNYFQYLLSWRDDEPWYNYAMCTDFSSPEEVDLGVIFYGGFEEDNELTDEEKKYLINQSWPEEDVERGAIRIPADKMDAVLKEYFGISLADTDGKNLDWFTYVPETDCYYTQHGDAYMCRDFGDMRIIVSSDEYDIYYYNDWRQGYFCMRLRRTDGKFQIISNQRVEDPSTIPNENANSETFLVAGSQLVSYFQNLISYRWDEPWYNTALDRTFHSPEEVDLGSLFYNGFAGENNIMTEGEQDYLIDQWGGIYTDVIRLPASKMDTVLQQYFGIDLENIDASGLTYWDETDCYYISHGDHLSVVVTVTNIERSSNEYDVFYYDKLWDDYFCLHLRLVDGIYQIVSNQRVGEPTEKPTEEPTAPENNNSDMTFEEVNETVYAISDVNIRKGPGTDYDKIVTLSRGESVTRTGIGDQGWDRVEYNGETAYIHHGYLFAEEPTEELTEEPVNGIVYPLTEANFSGTDLVHTGFEQEVTYWDDYKEIIYLPEIVLDAEFARAYNAQMLQFADEVREMERGAFYRAYEHDGILSIVVFLTTDKTSRVYYRLDNFDVKTGESLTLQDMYERVLGISYPEYLTLQDRAKERIYSNERLLSEEHFATGYSAAFCGGVQFDNDTEEFDLMIQSDGTPVLVSYVEGAALPGARVMVAVDENLLKDLPSEAEAYKLLFDSVDAKGGSDNNSLMRTAFESDGKGFAENLERLANKYDKEMTAQFADYLLEIYQWDEETLEKLAKKLPDGDLKEAILDAVSPAPGCLTAPGEQNGFIHSYPLGTTVRYDLNGDGVGEDILVEAREYADGKLTIGEASVKFGIGAPTGYFAIINTDTAKNTLLVGISQDTGSDDDYTTLYAYDGSSITEVGGFDDILGKDSHGNSGAVCHGDGTITARRNFNVLGTWRGWGRYAVDGKSVTDTTDFYSFVGGEENQNGWEVTTKVDLIMYEDESNSNSQTVIPAGTAVRMTGCMEQSQDAHWVAFEIDSMGMTLLLYTEEADWQTFVQTPNGLIDSEEAFDGFHYAG